MTDTANAPAQTRSARKDVEKAFAPVAQKLGLSFTPDADVDYTKKGTTFLTSMKGGLFTAVTIGDDGASRPVFPTLPPTKASILTNIYDALASVLPAASK